MDIKQHLHQITDALSRVAMERVKRIKKSDGHHIHVVVLAVEFLPPDGLVGGADVKSTFTDVEGLHLMASVLHDIYVQKKGN